MHEVGEADILIQAMVVETGAKFVMEFYFFPNLFWKVYGQSISCRSLTL